MMKQFQKWLDDLSVRKKLYFLTGIIFANSLWAVGFSVVVLDTLEGIRASVAVQNFWIDSANRAMFSLKNYARYGDDEEYVRYGQSRAPVVQFAIANREARKDRDQDLGLMRQGFLGTGANPDDVPAIVRLISRFGRLPYVSDAIAAWSKGHDFIDELHQIAESMHSEKSLSAEERREYLAKIADLEAKIVFFENKFVSDLSTAARLAEVVFYWTTLTVSFVVFVFSIACLVYINRRIFDGINRISIAAARASEGDFTAKVEYNSSDELGQLANSFNHMVASLTRMDELKGKAVEQSRLASLGEMAGGIAHEINNPLTIIRGQTEILVNHYNSDTMTPEVFRSKTAIVLEITERISRIIRGLRNFARDGSMEELRWHAVGKIIDDSAGLCREYFKVRGIELRTRVDYGFEIFCRDIQTSQVLVNLLNNARHAAGLTEEKWVEIGSIGTDDNCSIYVMDSGTGIPQELRQKIFQPFFTTKDIGNGTGLGLSISKGLIEGQNATLCLDEASPNTKFVITFPRCRRTS